MNQRFQIIRTILKYLALGLLLAIYSCERFPPSEFETGNVNLGSAYDLYVEGEYAYVTCNDGVAIIDFSHPEQPDLIETI